MNTREICKLWVVIIKLILINLVILDILKHNDKKILFVFILSAFKYSLCLIEII